MKKQMKSVLAAAMALSMTMACLTGCGQSTDKETDSAGASAGTEKVLTFGCQNYSGGSVDTAYQTSSAWNAMRYGVAESLFRFNDAMEVEPWLAESCEVSDDHKTWTIKLKDGIKFSNGEAMTASKVKASYDWLKESGPKGSSAPEKFLEYEAEITADDDAGTITIVTKKAYADLTKNLAHPVMSILDVDNIEDFDHNIIGTGPYVIESYKEDVGYTLVKNENYREEVPYDKVELYYMGDASAKAMALQNGQVDLVENITNVADIQKFQEDSDYKVDIANGVRCGFSYMNMKGILANDTLRQAVLMGIDDETICSSNLIGGLYTPGYSVLPSNLTYNYDTLKNPYAYDAEAAKALLDQAGIVDTDGNGIRELDGKDIVLHYVYYDNRLLKEFAQAQHNYLTAIGIEVDEDEVDSDTDWNMLVNGEYDLLGNNWTTVATGDPTEYLDNWYGKSNANYCGYQNDEYDKLYEQLLTELDNDTRTEIITRLQQILIDDAAVLVDGYYNSSMIASKNVAQAPIHTADYYWLSTEIKPAE